MRQSAFARGPCAHREIVGVERDHEQAVQPLVHPDPTAPACGPRDDLLVRSLITITPQAFEAAVVFERPLWPLLNTERRVMRYALKQIEAGGGRPSICDGGRRIEWRIAEPKLGTRYMCVAFHQNGMLLWNDNLQKHSLAGRIRRLVGRLAPG